MAASRRTAAIRPASPSSEPVIACARARAIPARYVSGYRFATEDGTPHGAAHAWAELHVPGLGWVGFDPTNDILAADDHIVLAVGRDYADVAPIDGVILATGAQTLKVEVDVVPEDGT